MCSFSTKETESKSQWKLCFKLYCLLDADSISVDSIEYLFLFEQVMKQNMTLSKVSVTLGLSFIILWRLILLITQDNYDFKSEIVRNVLCFVITIKQQRVIGSRDSSSFVGSFCVM